MEKPDFNKVRSLFCEKEETFRVFGEMLIRYNKMYNLTAITEEKEVLYKHFYDSLAGEGLFMQNERVVEIGSGAGFPSIPLKIVREDLSFTLVESTGKKCDFLCAAIRELGLKNAEVVHIRAEELGRTPAFREKFDVSCARAVARLNTLVEYCMPLVRVGGRTIAYKGEVGEELSEAERAIALLGGKKAEAAVYELPEHFGTRTLVQIEKIKPCPEKYPRGNGKERNRPIV